MKDLLRCPKCAGGVILHVAKVNPIRGDYLNLHTAATETAFTLKIHEYGVLEAYVCRGCGYTEWYTLRPQEIPVDGVHVRLLQRPEDPDPYR